MKKILIYCLTLGLLGLSACTQCPAEPEESVTRYVEPRIGTAHCRWFHFAPGSRPFGLAKPGPATNASLGNPGGWEATGYDYRDSTIEGFPCLHEFQVGGIVLMPTHGPLVTTPGTVNQVGDGYRSLFHHENEIVQPGYYSVLLESYDITTELTATERVAYMRFTYPENQESHLLFDIGNRQGESGPIQDAEVQILDGKTIEGWVETSPLYCQKYQKGAKVRLYFHAILDKEAKQYGTFRKNEIFENQKQIKGIGAGGYFTYATSEKEKITAKIGLSYTSVANAKNNLLQETNVGKKPFDTVQEESQQIWEENLRRIQVETPEEEDKIKFYTGLYHAILGRGLASDINGAYPKNDGTIGQIPADENGQPQFKFYNTDAIWGGQWNLVQVWALAFPEYLSDFVSTHIQVYKDTGWMGDGLACSRYVSGVGTNQVGNVISAAYNCGIRDFDIQQGYAAARKNELDGENRPRGAGKTDTDRFLQYGYVPHLDTGDHSFDENWRFSVSHTLEYSFGAYAVAQMANQLGQKEDYERLMDLSRGWERLYNEETGFIQPKKADGQFAENFNPMEVWRGYQEGNAYQYTFYVPHDSHHLISKVGTEEFVSRLDSIFTWSEDKIFSGGKTIDAFAGLQTYYNQGNQPCLHISWLFNEAGRYDLTQKWVRQILDKFYGTDGIHGYGYGQDEDQGQLGAWYVLSSIGLFDVKGLADENPEMAIGSTLFDKVTIRLNPDYYPGKEFVITAEGNAKDKYLVDHFEFNGQTLERPYLRFQDIVHGGKLSVHMAD